MKNSQHIQQQIAALKKQLASTKKHERATAAREFVKLAKSLGIYSLPPQILASEFRRITAKQSRSSVATPLPQEGSES